MSDAQGPSGGGKLGEIPYLRLPRPEALFAHRAERFAELSPGHTLAELLEFLSRIAKAQLAAWETVCAGRASTSGPPGPALSTNGDASGHPRSVRPERSAAESKGGLGDTWREILKVIVTELSARAIPAESRAALDRLERASREDLDALAARVLENAAAGSDLAAGPLVAAALQVEYTDRASRVDAASVARAESGCPVCGSLPVVGVVLGDDRLRYLVCSMCATQWHHTRIQCTACRGAEGLAHYALEGERAASVPVMDSVKAEACPRCKAYTKLLYLEKDPRIEPFADDVATLALDLLMAENGWARHGVNVFLMPSADGGGT